MHALVGTDRKRPADTRQGLVRARGQRLFDQRDAGTRAYGEVSFQIVRRPCLIGIDNQLGFRGRLTHGGDAHRIVIAAELDLQKRPVRRLGGRRRHYLRRPQRDRIGRHAGLGLRPSQQVPGPPRAAFGLEVHEGAIQRVAGGPWRHCGLQGAAVEPARDRLDHRFERPQARLGRLAIARVGHAFAAPGMAAMADLRHDGDGLRFGAAADRKAAGDRPALDSHAKCWKLAGSHFNIWQFLNRELARRHQLWLVRA